MRDTWIGSGIYAKDVYMTFNCVRCEEEVDLDGQTNDTQDVAYAQCPKCHDYLEEYLWDE